jgi:hypothetical protein
LRVYTQTSATRGPSIFWAKEWCKRFDGNRVFKGMMCFDRLGVAIVLGEVVLKVYSLITLSGDS